MNAKLKSERFPWRWSVALTTVGFIIRSLFVLFLHPVARFLYSDMSGAFQAAQTLADASHVLDRWDVARPRALGQVGAFLISHLHDPSLQSWGFLQALISTATVPLVLIGCYRFLGRRPAIVAAALVTFDFLAIGFAGYLMAETYLMFFLALAFACLDPERPLLCLFSGVALGIGGLFKAQALPLTMIWGALLLLWGARDLLRGSAGFGKTFATWLFARPRLALVLMALGVLAVQVPEMRTLSRIYGHRTLFPPYGGQNFYLGHCDVKLLTLDGRPNGGYLLSLSAKAVELNEPWPDITFYVSVLDSAFFVHEGMKCVTRSIPHALRWGAEQLLDTLAGVPGSTLDPWPMRMDQPRTSRVFNFALSYVLVPLALMGLWLRRRELGAWLAIGGPLAAIWGLALLFSGNPRYREPFDIFILAGASVALVALWDRFGLRSIASPSPDALLDQGAPVSQP